jgi:beta-lactamase superfamily II metal-dependent hydrolase
MAIRYVNRKTARLYEATSGRAFHMVMIFGDEVDVAVNSAPVNGRLPGAFRGHHGFVREDQIGTQPAMEIYFIDVGQGDATFIVTPGRRKILIDGGLNRRALGFLIWKYRLDRAENSVDVDLLVLSHADGDHLRGLVPIIEHDQIHVQQVIHSGIATFASGAFDTALGDLDSNGEFLITWHDQINELNTTDLSDEFRAWRDAIVNEGTGYRGVDTETDIDFISNIFPDVSLEILGPRYDFDMQGFPWFGDKAHTINGHSVVLRLTFGGVQALFPGDLNIPGSEHLLEDPVLANSMNAHIFKCPHHGSHEFHPPFLEAVRPQISSISSGDAPDHGHPRAVLLGAIGNASRSMHPLLFSTEIAAAFVDAGETIPPEEANLTLDALDFSNSAANVTARRLFKQRLPGIINVRTNGSEIFVARRVAAGYWWEAYGPLQPAP